MAGSSGKTRGLTNCALTFTSGGDKSIFRTRCRAVGHGFEVVATESQARRYRAFYPHQRALSPFVVTFELIGYPELKRVMEYFRSYIDKVILVTSNYMTVSVPSRNFLRAGVPIGGVIDTDHTGSNVFQPTVVFETVTDPLDTRIFTRVGPRGTVSTVDLAMTQRDDASKFFYPSSAAVNDPNAQGDSFYDTRPVPDTPFDPELGYEPIPLQPGEDLSQLGR